MEEKEKTLTSEAEFLRENPSKIFRWGLNAISIYAYITIALSGIVCLFALDFLWIIILLGLLFACIQIHTKKKFDFALLMIAFGHCCSRFYLSFGQTPTGRAWLIIGILYFIMYVIGAIQYMKYKKAISEENV